MSKNIIVCYDGTGNEPGKNVTNVVKIYNLVVNEDPLANPPPSQIALYDSGVGTVSGLGKRFGGWIGVKLGKAFGWGLQKNIEDGYKYLVEHFNPGGDGEDPDKVFIFGFSRGAFTARSLAGMIHYSGVLRKENKKLIPMVSKSYNKRKFDKLSEIKNESSNDCKPHFIGVWDTVASLGHVYGKRFFDQTLNRDIKHGRHAVAIDEKRKKFPVSLWDENAVVQGQNVQQVWFVGSHSDVGGYYHRSGLSDIALAWMIDNAVAQGMRVTPGWQAGLLQNCGGHLHDSRTRWWKIWQSIDRDIPRDAKIHRSVFDRINMVASYEPANIEKHHLEDANVNGSYLHR